MIYSSFDEEIVNELNNSASNGEAKLHHVSISSSVLQRQSFLNLEGTIYVKNNQVSIERQKKRFDDAGGYEGVKGQLCIKCQFNIVI